MKFLFEGVNMIYSIIVFNKTSGIPLYSHHFKEFAGDASLASGMVMAITSFLEELQLGTLKSFITHEKKVIIVPTNILYVALVIDLDDLESQWESRAADIGVYIEEKFQLYIKQSRALKEKDEGADLIIEKLLYEEDKAGFILQEIENQLFPIPSLFGVIILDKNQVEHKLVKKDFEDFELEAFMDSPFPDRMISLILPTLEQSYNTLKIGNMDYCRIETMMLNVFLFKISSSLYIGLFLDKEHEIALDHILPLFKKLEQIK